MHCSNRLEKQESVAARLYKDTASSVSTGHPLLCPLCATLSNLQVNHRAECAHWNSVRETPPGTAGM